MKPGDVVRQKKVRHQYDKKNWVEFTDGARYVAVLMYMGAEPIEPKEGEELDTKAVMAELGWRPMTDDEWKTYKESRK